jgi:hypothetical protein
MTNTDYRALPGLTATDLKAGAVSMRHMRASVMGELRRESKAITFGQRVHAAMLQPETFWTGVTVWRGGLTKKGEPTMSTNSEAYRELEAQFPGNVLTQAEYERLERCVDAVHAEPEIADMLLNSEHEVLRQWQDRLYGAAKCRFDFLIPGRLWGEVKTTRAVNPEQFAAQFYGRGLRYDIQGGWYHFGEPDLPTEWVVIRTEEPFKAWLQSPERGDLEAFGETARELALRYRACEAAGEYPDVVDSTGRSPWIKPRWVDGGDWTVGDTTEGTAEV